MANDDDNVDRIYIGGLSSSTSVQCIETLLKPFGQVDNVDVNPRGFAHVSLSCASSKVDRCITALNRTLWRDNVLRLERARKHYMRRLKEEWDEYQAGHEKDIGNGGATAPGKDGVDRVVKPVKFLWKGKYVRFDDVDDDDDGNNDDPAEDYLNSNENEGDTETRTEKQSQTQPKSAKNQRNTDDVNINSDKNDADTKDNNADAVREWERKKTTKTVQSTLSLFGLSFDKKQDEQPSTLPEKENRSKKRKEQTNVVSNDEGTRASQGDEQLPSTKLEPPQKPPKPKVKMNLARADAIGNDSALIDLDLERNAALSILSTMFANKSAGPAEVRGDSSSSVRRAGLYKRLVIIAKEPSNASNEKSRASQKKRKMKMAGKFVSNNNTKSAKTMTKAIATESAFGTANIMNVGQGAANTKIRRKGLYKRLSLP